MGAIESVNVTLKSQVLSYTPATPPQREDDASRNLKALWAIMGPRGFLVPRKWGPGPLPYRALAESPALSSFIWHLPRGADIFLRPVQEEGGWWLHSILEG